MLTWCGVHEQGSASASLSTSRSNNSSETAETTDDASTSRKSTRNSAASNSFSRQRSQRRQRRHSGSHAAETAPSEISEKRSRESAAQRTERLARTRSFGTSTTCAEREKKQSKRGGRNGKSSTSSSSEKNDGLRFDSGTHTQSQGSHFAHYMAEVGKTTLLEKSDEVRLCGEIQNLQKMQALRDDLESELGRAPSESEWASASGFNTVNELHKRLDECLDAKNMMIKANIRLVVNLAQKYQSMNNLALADLVQEGTVGLIKAAERFDASRGFKFASYAHWWIRQRLSNSREKVNTVRVPAHMLSQIGKQSNEIYEFEQQYGRQPTDEELAKRMNMSVSKVQTLKRCSQMGMSLDQEYASKEGSGGTLSEVTADQGVPEPVDEADDMLRRSSLHDVLNTLETKERDVLVLRYGLDDGRTRTLEAIGKRYDVTRERVRQIEQSALHKLRSPSRSRALTDHAQWAGIPADEVANAVSAPDIDALDA